MRRACLLLTAVALVAAMPAAGGVIGHTAPPAPLTMDRVASLPAARAAWQSYLARSAAAARTDRAALAAERVRLAVAPEAPPGAKGSSKGMPLDRDATWYAGAEARGVADNIVSFQTPTGGWGKNQDRTGPIRVAGQAYAPTDGITPAIAGAGDVVGGWNFIGTVDNEATTTELRFLARVAAATGEARYRAAFAKGVRYLLDAQYPGGGWPQVYPLQGGYHDAVTLNDDAMLHVVALMEDVGKGTADTAFAPAALRRAAAASAARGLDALLALQVVIDGRRTVWAQQYDAVTLRPVAGRNYEPIALASGESARVLRFLMARPDPSPAVRRAIEDGAAWFAAHAITGRAWEMNPREGGKRLSPRADAPALWARFYDPATGRPIFGDRDRTIHDDVNDLIPERRTGYAWFNTAGSDIAREVAAWRAGQ